MINVCGQSLKLFFAGLKNCLIAKFAPEDFYRLVYMLRCSKADFEEVDFFRVETLPWARQTTFIVYHQRPLASAFHRFQSKIENVGVWHVGVTECRITWSRCLHAALQRRSDTFHACTGRYPSSKIFVMGPCKHLNSTLEVCKITARPHAL